MVPVTYELTLELHSVAMAYVYSVLAVSPVKVYELPVTPKVVSPSKTIRKLVALPAFQLIVASVMVEVAVTLLGGSHQSSVRNMSSMAI